MKGILLEIGAGELLDRLAILELKARHAKTSAQRAQIDEELRRARGAGETAGLALPLFDPIAPLVAELHQINERLWEVEDRLRLCEERGDFGTTFVELSRSVYRHNDRRATIKRQIDQRLSPAFVQDKIYAHHATPRESEPG